jgi:RHS repeat-associated protein
MQHTSSTSIPAIEPHSSTAQRTSRWTRNMSFVALALLLWCAMAASASAQNVQYNQGGGGAGLDNTIQIPLRAYPGRGAASLPVTLYYSSRVWRIKYTGTIYNSSDASQTDPMTQARYAEFSTAGWTSSLGIPMLEWPESNQVYDYTGKPKCLECSSTPYSPDYYYKVPRLTIHMPDGSAHELRRDDTPYTGATNNTGNFYAVDGSRLRYDTTTATLYLPDGSRYILGETTVQFIDRNGNTLNYNRSTGQWTDTLGRAIYAPPLAGSPGDYTYSLPGVNGTSVTYTLRWKSLSDVLEPDPETGVTPTLKYAGDYYTTGTPSITNLPQPQSPSLFQSNETNPDLGTYDYVIGSQTVFNPVVLSEIDLPNGTSYKFTYNEYGEIVKTVYPTGGFEECKYDKITPVDNVSAPYDQSNRGVVSRWVSPSGSGTDRVQWQSGAIYDGNANTYKVWTLNPDNTYTERYLFKALPFSPHTNQNYAKFGFEDPRNGMPYEERFYQSKNGSSLGPMLRRSLTDSTYSARTVTVNYNGLITTATAMCNPRPTKEVSLILDTGTDPALAKTVTYGYDTSSPNEFTTGLNRTLSTESYFDNVDQTTAQTAAINTISPGTGTLASSAVTTYVDSANPNYSSYQSRNILGLVTSVVLEDANNQPVSKSETVYDEAAYAVTASGDTTIHQTSGDVVTWINPDSSVRVRGNATTVRHYVTLSPETYLESHVSYDQWGNARSAIDARGNQSTVDYSSDYNYAYATQTTSAVPDPSGAHGSTAAFTSSSVFDSHTGLVLSTTDANNQITHFSYTDSNNVTDPLDRLRKVTRPDNSYTTTDYHDSANDLATTGMYVETKSSFETGRTTTARQYYDHLGRSVRSFASDNSDPNLPWIVSDTYYDPVMGRVSQVSNPYRTATPSATVPTTCSLCTSSQYDALGRVYLVTLPDATTVQTTYQGIYTTVQDQAGKTRRQKVDALGRVVRVDEPDTSGSLGSVDAPTQASYFGYNTAGNLIHIQQGVGTNLQHRYFKYDALGRLTYERQVEQAATITAADALTGNSQWSRHLVYDENGYQGLPTTMTDARGVSTQFQYDNLNRAFKVTYSDGTPSANSYYDQQRTGYQLNKGHLTTVTTAAVAASDPLPAIPATSQSYDYDLMGRIAHQQQVIGSQSYTLSYGYNLGGELTSETYPSGRVVSYGYNDAAGLNSVISGTKTYASQFDYSSAQGLLKSVTLGNGAVESYDYNNRLQLNSINLAKDNNTLQRYEYKYGAVQADGSVDESKNNGQLGRIEGFIGTTKQWQQRFSYDSLGRLSQASEYRGDNGQQSYLNNYNYDAFGNRYQKAASNPANNNPLAFTPVEDTDINQATNRFTFSQITYDNAGNLTTDNKFTARQYTYDANNRQRTATRSDGVGGTYTSVYDGAGQRVATINNGVTNYLVYDAGGKLVAEYGQTASTNGTSYIFADHQGSTRVVMGKDAAGQMTLSRHDYEPFGSELQAGVGLRTSTQGYGASDSARQKYAGMETDDGSSLEHTLWRKYDAQSGRWTSPDPYGGSMTIASPQSFNRYAYVNNDPINHVDPTGLMMAGADQGYGSFEGWGGDPGFFDPHFGGPGIIQNGMDGFPDRNEEESQSQASGDGDDSPYKGDPTSDPDVASGKNATVPEPMDDGDDEVSLGHGQGQQQGSLPVAVAHKQPPATPESSGTSQGSGIAIPIGTLSLWGTGEAIGSGTALTCVAPAVAILGGTILLARIFSSIEPRQPAIHGPGGMGISCTAGSQAFPRPMVPPISIPVPPNLDFGKSWWTCRASGHLTRIGRDQEGRIVEALGRGPNIWAAAAAARANVRAFVAPGWHLRHIDVDYHKDCWR